MSKIKKGQNWGGHWTEEKLKAFTKYVNAYLTIMNRYRDKYNWQLIYFDGFAGSGTTEHAPEVTPYTGTTLLNELENESFYSPSQENVYKGAAERVLDIKQRGFDIYYFIDLNPDSKHSLEEHLEKYKISHNLQFRCEDANEMLKKFAKYLHEQPNGKRTRSLVLLDPFGMQINWKSLERFKETNIDVWILVPTGVIINRLIDRKCKLTNINKLVDFFWSERARYYKLFLHSKN